MVHFSVQRKLYIWIQAFIYPLTMLLIKCNTSIIVSFGLSELCYDNVYIGGFSEVCIWYYFSCIAHGGSLKQHEQLRMSLLQTSTIVQNSRMMMKQQRCSGTGKVDHPHILIVVSHLMLINSLKFRHSEYGHSISGTPNLVRGIFRIGCWG